MRNADGVIPYGSVADYADRLRLSPVMHEHFVTVVMSTDRRFRAAVEKSQEQAAHAQERASKAMQALKGPRTRARRGR